MKLRDLMNETMLREEPSINSTIKFDVGKEIEDMKQAILKYEQSAFDQTTQTLRRKLVGNHIDGKNGLIEVTDVFVKQSEEGDHEYTAYVKTSDGKTIGLPNQINIQNDNDAPVTSVTQNTAQPSNTSPHKVTQF